MAADGNVEIELLQSEVAAQGLIVRGLKENKAEKAQIDEAVAKLVALKKRLAELTGAPEEGQKKDKKKEAATADASSAGHEAREAAKDARRLAREQAAASAKAVDVPAGAMRELVASSRFGKFNLIRSQPSSLTGRVFTDIKKLGPHLVGQTVNVRGYLQNSMSTNKKRVFVHLREAIYTVQAVVQTETEGVTADMVKFVTSVSKESIVDVEAVVGLPPDPIESCTCSNIELYVSRFYLVNEAAVLPFSLADASAPNTGDDDQTSLAAQEAAASAAAAEGRTYAHVGQELRLNYRWIDVRTRANQGIFRLQAVVCRAFREFLTSQGFTEIHTPKFVATASEGGAGVFKVEYMEKNRHVYLAQSPQLYKQMAICSGLQRVFEVGHVYRAENSNTNRHLTEFVGLDMEMEFKEDYMEVLHTIARMFVAIFDELGKDEYADLRQAVCEQHPFTPLAYPRETLILTYKEGMQILADAGHEFTGPKGRLEDLDTPTEKKLGRLVKERYGTDFYILNKFPTHIRPFYTMPADDEDGGLYSNSYDIFIRGQEIVSGAQRIHDPEMLLARAAALNIDLTPVQAYIDSFKYGAPPHAGCGVGMERLIMLYLGLTNIRKTSFFPRDPVRVTP